MSNLVPNYDLTRITDTNQFMRFSSDLINQILALLNGKLDFNNLKTQTVAVSFPFANKDVAINHNLQKSGVLYFPVSLSAPAIIYSGSVGNSATVYLRASAACTASVILF